MKQAPRDYQIEALNSTWSALHNTSDNLLCISPTGTGKTFIINALIKRMVTTYKKTRVLVITHNKDIIRQNAASMKKFWKTSDVGINSSGLRRNDTRNKIIYAGIQSIHKKVDQFRGINVVFIDEAHLLSPNEGTMYQKFIRELQAERPMLRILFFSATPYRLGQGHLLESEMVDSIAFDFTQTEKFMWFVAQGYLSRLITKKAVREIDVTEARMRGGEFNDSDVQRLSNTEENNRAVVEECIRYGMERNHWMVFASGVEHGEALREQFEAYGIGAVNIHAASDGREDQLLRWERGEVRVLVNVGLYTTGYDFPALDLIAVARATQSTALWVQMCGRGTRCLYADGYDQSTQDGRLSGIAASRKQDCLVLDFAGNTRRLGPINAPIIPSPRRKGDKIDGVAPVKTCPQCETYNHTRAAKCETCGFEFPPPETVTREAGTDDIMVSDAMEPNHQSYGVLNVSFKRSSSPTTGREYFQCTYHSFTHRFKTILFPGFPAESIRKIFEDWWWSLLTESDKKLNKGRANYKFPSTIEQALTRAGNELRVPTTIVVDTNSKYKTVTGVGFE